ncbi:phosphohydrolase [Spirochaetia bacterium]|nr:phosphohydrolase [Spirochaetia bacterium]
MAEYKVEEIPEDSFFSAPVFLDQDFIIASPETPFTLQLSNTLKAWEFPKVSSDGEPREKRQSSDAGKTGAEPEELDIEVELPLITEEDHLRRAGDLYSSLMRYTSKLFIHITAGGALDYPRMEKRMTGICGMVKEERRYLLRMMEAVEPKRREDKEDNWNFLVVHSVKSMIISLVIGTYLKLPDSRLVELGIAALLHEAGMLSLPPALYLHPGPLSSEDWKALHIHPVQSYTILKNSNLPKSILMAVLEHHERESGEGYPRKIPGAQISLYAKIIAVACSYEAMTTARPYKKTKNSHDAILELLKNEGGQYHSTVIRALIFSLSIYPIGIHVLLSDNTIGQVVETNPENPRFPLVIVLCAEKGEQKIEGPNLVATAPDGIFIIRPVDPNDTGAL